VRDLLLPVELVSSHSAMPEKRDVVDTSTAEREEEAMVECRDQRIVAKDEGRVMKILPPDLMRMRGKAPTYLVIRD